MLGNFFKKVGIKPLTDLVTGENGIASILKENSKPSSKISARKSCASALLFGAVVMAATGVTSENQWVILGFVVCGTAMMIASAWNREK